MSAHFHIEDLAPYNGDHEIDFSWFTNGELHRIKQISGVRYGEFEDAFEARDNDLLVAFTAIALERGGHVVDLDVLWNAPVGRIELVNEKKENEPRPPGSRPQSGKKKSAGDSADG